MKDTANTSLSNVRAAVLSAAAIAALVSGVGCKEPGYLRNQEPALRNPVASYRADSAGRIYPADSARVKNAAVRSQIGYMAKTVDVVNLGDTNWENVEVWVNGQYVCYLPRMEKGILKSIPWDALFDREGRHLPKDSRTFVVSTVELFIGGKLYEVPVTIAY